MGFFRNYLPFRKQRLSYFLTVSKPSEINDFRGLFLILDSCGAGGEPAYVFNMILRSNSSAISSRS